MSYIIVLIAAVGLNFIFIESKLFYPVRKFFMDLADKNGCGSLTDRFSEAINCHQCLGFWTGFLMQFSWILLGNENFSNSTLFSCILMGLSCSIISHFSKRIFYS